MPPPGKKELPVSYAIQRRRAKKPIIAAEYQVLSAAWQWFQSDQADHERLQLLYALHELEELGWKPK